LVSPPRHEISRLLTAKALGAHRTVRENGPAAFERKNKRADEGKDRQIVALQEKLASKNEVIAELMEENVRSKKANGEL
jgi:hypothetical protein